jgi:hypothetical protein
MWRGGPTTWVAFYGANGFRTVGAGANVERHQASCLGDPALVSGFVLLSHRGLESAVGRGEGMVDGRGDEIRDEDIG